MKKICNTKRIVCVMLVLMLASVGICAMAEKENSINYAVCAVLPDNQLDEQAAYFDLLVKPGQNQVLQVIIKNKGDTDIEVAVEANTAFSNDYGVIEFTQSDKRDASLAVDFAQIVKPVESVVKVPANSEVTAEFLLEVPDGETFEGTVYGGLMFTKQHQGEGTEGEGSVSIRNIYRYVIGVRLRESEAAAEPTFELTGAEIGKTNSPTLLLGLCNPRPVIARGIKLYARVYPSNSDDVVAMFERDGVAMAPNSSMNYTIYFDDNKMSLKAGEYCVSVELWFEEDSWQFEAPLIVD